MKRFVIIGLMFWMGLSAPVLCLGKYEALRESLENFASTHPGNISITFVDLTNSRKVAIAEDRVFNPASVIKVPVMVEVYSQIHRNRLSLDDRIVLRKQDKISGSGVLQYHRVGNSYTVRHLVELMITLSDNTATKILIERVGKQNINRSMQKLGLTQTVIGNSNLLEAEGLNFSTPGDMASLLTKIYRGQVISEEASREMLAVLGRQHVKWGIPRYLPSQTRVANKTGTLSYVKNDSGIVFFEDRPYVISVFTSKLENRPFGKTWVAEISRIIYDWRAGEVESEYSYVP